MRPFTLGDKKKESLIAGIYAPYTGVKTSASNPFQPRSTDGQPNFWGVGKAGLRSKDFLSECLRSLAAFLSPSSNKLRKNEFRTQSNPTKV